MPGVRCAHVPDLRPAGHRGTAGVRAGWVVLCCVSADELGLIDKSTSATVPLRIAYSGTSHAPWGIHPLDIYGPSE